MRRNWLPDLLMSLAITATAILGVALLAFLDVRWPIALSIAFGIPTAFLLAQLPSALIYQVFPDGGGEAFVGFAIIGAVIQFFVISLLVLRRSHRKNLHPES